ncbi:MAG: DsbE family thiol:disulfide interchange protein [Alphaproteobacteria bacterium]|nr:DsbE family thiol:disulfide interchange protein [Alphaproteobacteria bacterium]
MPSPIYIVPTAIFAVMAALLGWGLTSDPSKVPSALIGKPLPSFDLPALDGAAQSLATGDVAPEGVTVINVFASWCVPCRAEHPILTEIARWDGVKLYGIAYKNTPEDARAWLNELGDPYTRIGADLDGRVGIDLGVYGVPETFFVGADGNIHYKHIGPIMEQDVEERIRPLIIGLTQ